MKLTGLGIFAAQLRWGGSAEIPEAAAELEQPGFSALWFGDISPGPIFDDAARLLSATERVVVGTAVLNLWMHDADEVATGVRELASQFPGRFLLGIGVSHGPLVDQQKPGAYRRPLAAMRQFLDQLDACGVAADERPLAALGPNMLGLARDRATGALPYLVTPAHTAVARAALGPEALLAVEQGVILETDADVARARARGNLAMYLALPNYRNNLLRHGFTEHDLHGAGSDRLVDELIIWGGLDRIAERIAQHRAAGADHVSLQVITEDFQRLPLTDWRRLGEIAADTTAG
jgi:probable F420-dependent oxidoreductase